MTVQVELGLASGHRRALPLLSCESLLLPMFEGRAQPRNVAGHVDWRMCGRIARMVRSDRFGGRSKEVLLTPSRGRIGPERVFLFGLGKPAAPKEPHIRFYLERALQVVADAGGQDLAIGFSAAPSFLADADDALDADLVLQVIDVLPGLSKRFRRIRFLHAEGGLAPHAETLGRFAKDRGVTWSPT